MALVGLLEQITMEKNSVHEKADCTYTVFSSDDGDMYLQIDTYGSPHRKIKGKKSQSIQLNSDSARALHALLAKEFRL